MIVRLPDGRSIDIPTDDVEVAKNAAASWAKDNPFVERGAQLGEEDISAVGDVLRGVGAGLVGAVEGIATLPTEAFDFITGSEEGSTEELRRFFNKYKPETTTGLGEASRFITQFATPGGLAVKAARALKAKKAIESEGFDPTDVATFGIADIAATTPDVETLGDFFEAGPTQRVDTQDLVGAELAAANLSNRLRVAAEGAAVVLGVPAIARLGFTAIGEGADKLADNLMVKAAAQAIKDPNTPFHGVGIKPDLQNPTFFQRNMQTMRKKAREYLTFQGAMPDRFVKQLNQMKVAEVSAHNNAVRQAVSELDNTMSFVNKNGGIFNDQDRSRILNTVNDYLFAEPIARGSKMIDREAVKIGAEKELKEIDDIIAKNMPKSLFGKKELSLFKPVEKLRSEIDGLSGSIKDMIDDPLLDASLKSSLSETIENNKTYYGIRLYRAFKDPNYQPTRAQEDAAANALVEATKNLPADEALNNQQARSVLNQLFQARFGNAKMNPSGVIDPDTLTGIAQGPLKGRKLDNLPEVRDFLGEYTGAKEVVGRMNPSLVRTRDVAEQEVGLRTRIVDTVDVLAKIIAKDKYFKNIVDYNDTIPGANKFLFDELPEGAPLGSYSRIGAEGTDPLREVSIGAKEKYGKLAGKYVLNEYKAAFEDLPKYFNTESLPLYATFLGLKGISQIAKTVLSPITQIRNATTAAFFALANGNVGNANALVDSVATVLSNIANKRVSFGKSRPTKKEIDDYYNELVDLGVINTNAKIGEFESLLNDAVETTQYMPGLVNKGFNKARNIQNTLAGKLYQGSDDVWKAYSYEMELGKLKNVFKNNKNASIPVSDPRNLLEIGQTISGNLSDDVLETALKREAAEIVKDTVPNYARVPEAIKQLRRLPFGNFIAFPAEIIRTSGNILGRAVKELASESPEIRSIGMKRLLGSISVNAAIPATLYNAGLLLTGSDNDQVQAYKRSAAYEWDRNSTLIPVATDKDGKITDLYNFSYTNPYDYMARPFKAVYNAVQNGITSEKELTEIAFDSTFGESGAFYEFFAPFMDESIITEKVFDVLRNKTSFGADVWNDADPLGLKMAKGFAHLADGVMPGVSPVDIKADVASPGFLTVASREFPKAIGSIAGVDPEKTVGRQGYQVDPAQEFAEALTGVKSLKPRIDRTLYYRGLEAAREVREAARIFNQVAKSRGNKSAEDITKAFITANEQRFKALRDLNTAVEDAKTLGFSTNEIIKPLREAKTPNLNFVMAGRFKAFFPSNETISFALQENQDKLSNPFNMADMSREYSRFQGKLFREPQPQPQPAPQIAPAQPSVPPVDQSEIAPAEPASLFNRGTQALRDLELRKLLGID
jgi:hypothetical protein